MNPAPTAPASSDAFVPASAPASPAPIAPSGLRRFLTTPDLVRFGILALAAGLRLWDIDLRPPHFDEGVNGWFTDQMQINHFYAYDPTNYHGPLHFYVLFLFKCLFGRQVWALRLPVIIVGVLTVELLFRFRQFFGQRTCAWAALAMAVSPAFLYFQRDAIHETWLVYFLVLSFWGLCGMVQNGAKRFLWAVGMGITGMILTKETYIVHLGCFLFAIPILALLENFFPSTVRPLFANHDPVPPTPPGDAGTARESLWADPLPPPPLFPRFSAGLAPQRWRDPDLLAVVAVGLLLITLFYSGFGFNPKGIEGLITSMTAWGHKGNDGEGHAKPFVYWIKLLLRHEPWAWFGLLASVPLVVPSLPRPRRVLGTIGLVLCLGIAGFHLAKVPQWEPARTALAHFEGQVFKDALKAQWGLGVVTAGLGVLSIACLGLPRPADWRMRLLAIYAGGTVLAYSLIPYKTPWCLISYAWPFFFIAGALLVKLRDNGSGVARWAVPLAGGALTLWSGYMAVDLSFFHPTDEERDYVYVQTFDDVWKIVDPLLALARDDPSKYHLHGIILCGSTYPLPWLLGDFTGIGYYSDKISPPDYAGDFMIAIEGRVTEMEAHLQEEYYKEVVHLRPAQEPLTLYFRASEFARYLPGRTPEFHPPAGAVLPDAPAGPTPAPTVPPEAENSAL